MAKVKHLVVDSNAFIKNVQLQELCENAYTTRSVISEIRDRQTRARLEFLPYKLDVLEPTDESIAAVIKFSKATGDYSALSKTDIHVLAVAHQLHLRYSDVPLRAEPLTGEQLVTYEKDKSTLDKNMPGFVTGPAEGDSDSDDDEGWIDSSNYKPELTCEQEIPVGCYTTDFAMQNTLLSMGLEIISPTGKRVTSIRTWTLRCYACFKITNNMDKKFCPRCGNSTLKRVSVTVDENGQKKIHLNPRVNITGRGKRFPLPKPQGGKHVVQPVLTADQKICQDKDMKANRRINDVFRDDLIQGSSPFLQKDVNTKSVVLHQGTKYWERKNPNASHK